MTDKTEQPAPLALTDEEAADMEAKLAQYRQQQRARDQEALAGAVKPAHDILKKAAFKSDFADLLAMDSPDPELKAALYNFQTVGSHLRNLTQRKAEQAGLTGTALPE